MGSRLIDRNADGIRGASWLGWMAATCGLVLWTACSTLPPLSGIVATPVPEPTSQPDGSNRRSILERTARSAPASRPADHAASQPADSIEVPAYRLSPESIVNLVFELSPQVLASREQMGAAQHALEE